MTVSNPHLWPFFLLVLVPPLLHFLDRRRARVVVWPALRFLLDVDERRQRRLRLLEAVLLLLRMLVVGLFVLAVLQPVSEETIARPAATAARRQFVLVFDVSWSTSYRPSEGVASRLERARQMALRLIDSLTPTDVVTVVSEPVYPDGEGGRPVDEPVVDLREARKSVQELSHRGGEFSLYMATRRAMAALRSDVQASETYVFVFSDLQATSWRAEDASRWRALWDQRLSVGDELRLELVDCGGEVWTNRSCRAVLPDALATSPRESTRLNVRIITSVGGDSPPNGPADADVRARVVANGVDIGEQRFTLDRKKSPNGPVRHIPVTLPSGLVTLEVALSPDGLAGDDSHFSLWDLPDAVPVAIAGSPASTRFVFLALAPPERERNLGARFLLERISDLALYDLAKARVVILCGSQELTADVAARLERFVRDGGGLLVLAGESVDVTRWNDLLFRGRHGVLPVRLGRRVRAGPSLHHPDIVARSHPALAPLVAAEEVDWSKLAVRRWSAVSDLADDARVLTRIVGLSGPAPWLLEKSVGHGRVLLLTTAFVPDDSDLARSSLAVPVMHLFVRYLATRSLAGRSVDVGQPLAIRLPLEQDGRGRPVIVVDPEGRRREMPLRIEGGQLVGGLAQTDTPGFYTIEWERLDGELERRVYCVNIPVGESSLERIRAEDLATLPFRVTREPSGAQTRLVETTEKRPHWRPALAAALVCLLVEMVVARRLSRPAA